MLICDKCGAQIPEGSKFCPQCADPVTEADKVKAPSKAPSQPIRARSGDTVKAARVDVSAKPLRLVCPKCQAQNVFPVHTTQSSQSHRCPTCGSGFVSRLVQIRSKRSRGSKKSNTRQFTVRVYYSSGAEDLIEFVNANYQDFELRSKDIAVFSYLGGELKIVQNLTVSRYMTVSKPKCYLATYVYGPHSREVAMLRCFRDTVLLPSPPLSWLVNVYYRTSPLMIRWFGNNWVFRATSTALVEIVLRLVLDRAIYECQLTRCRSTRMPRQPPGHRVV